MSRTAAACRSALFVGSSDHSWMPACQTKVTASTLRTTVSGADSSIVGYQVRARRCGLGRRGPDCPRAVSPLVLIVGLQLEKRTVLSLFLLGTAYCPLKCRLWTQTYVRDATLHAALGNTTRRALGES